jgi:DNA-binding NtrC family response regulator
VQSCIESRKCLEFCRPPRPDSAVLNGELVHESSVMRELVESIALVARSNAPVLILGESGTGKERVARAIHAGGGRASQPFIAVNAAAIPEPLW